MISGKSIVQSVVVVILLLGTGLLVSCRTVDQEVSKADVEAYDIIGQKQQAALGAKESFSISTHFPKQELAAIPAAKILAERRASGTESVDLSAALDLAVRQNREYQTRKESLYLSALTLSDQRHRYDPLPDAETSLERERTGSKEYRNSADTQVSVSQLLKSGGSLALTLANDILRYTTGDPRESATSAISVSLVQPLLRGAGREIAAESLKQAERNVIYEVRRFARYQKVFAVEIASQYYRLAQQKDTVYNEYSNYQNLVRARKRSAALAKDRLPEFQVDQTRQDELRARNRYIIAVDRYLAGLDDFKETLGLPQEYDLKIDESSLAKLTEAGLQPVHIAADGAFQLALTGRLDLLTEIDRFDDEKRKILVAADQLKAEVEFLADASIPSTGDRHWEKFNRNNWTGSVGVRIKLPIDRVNERNDLRRRTIDFEQQLRRLGLAVDGVYTEIRQAVRDLEQSRKSHEIQRLSVELAERRVESATLLLQAGRAETRDLLEAQNALVQARNGLTQNLVDYNLARLRLLRDMGRLKLTDGRLVPLLDLSNGDGAGAENEELITPAELFDTEGEQK